MRGAAPGAPLLVADIFGSDPAGGNALALARALGWLAAPAGAGGRDQPGRARPTRWSRARSRRRRRAACISSPRSAMTAAPRRRPYPASYPGVIAVTGVDGRGRVLIEAGRALHLDYAAPGADMAAAARGGLVAVRGTSFAVPLVAGRLAQHLGAATRSPRSTPKRARGRGVGRGIVCGDCRTPPRRDERGIKSGPLRFSLVRTSSLRKIMGDQQRMKIVLIACAARLDRGPGRRADPWRRWRPWRALLGGRSAARSDDARRPDGQWRLARRSQCRSPQRPGQRPRLAARPGNGALDNTIETPRGSRRSSANAGGSGALDLGADADLVGTDDVRAAFRRAEQVGNVRNRAGQTAGNAVARGQTAADNARARAGMLAGNAQDRAGALKDRATGTADSLGVSAGASASGNASGSASGRSARSSTGQSSGSGQPSGTASREPRGTRGRNADGRPMNHN